MFAVTDEEKEFEQNRRLHFEPSFVPVDDYVAVNYDDIPIVKASTRGEANFLSKSETGFVGLLNQGELGAGGGGGGWGALCISVFKRVHIARSAAQTKVVGSGRCYLVIRKGRRRLFDAHCEQTLCAE